MSFTHKNLTNKYQMYSLSYMAAFWVCMLNFRGVVSECLIIFHLETPVLELKFSLWCHFHSGNFSFLMGAKSRSRVTENETPKGRHSPVVFPPPKKNQSISKCRPFGLVEIICIHTKLGTPPRFDIAPEKWWLEDDPFLLGSWDMLNLGRVYLFSLWG